MTKTARKKEIRKRSSKRNLVLLLCIELMCFLLLAFVLSRFVSFNTNTSIIFADEEYTDTVNCKNGNLIVNNVTVTVPSRENTRYNISYSWGKNDTDYPSVPHSATAAYCSKDGSFLYDISLYRDSFVPGSEMPSGKNASNWFDDWEIDGENSEESTITGPFGSSFLISSLDKSDDDNSSNYETQTFYFTVPEDDGLSIYILEGILYDHNSQKDYMHDITKSMSSIQIK